MLIFKNTGKSIFVCNLDGDVDYGHPECCKSHILMDLPAEAEDGTIGIRRIDHKLGGAVTWLAGETKTLPDAVYNIPEIRARVNAGYMRVTRIVAAPGPVSW